MEKFKEVLNTLLTEAVWPFVGFLFVVAIAYFIYGLIEFVSGADNEEKRTVGKRHLVWGIVGLFIMFSVWGIIQIILSFIGSIN